MHTVEIGQPYPLGATVDETGTNFALELATAKGYDVDQPRNLAKSVTVE